MSENRKIPLSLTIALALIVALAGCADQNTQSVRTFLAAADKPPVQDMLPCQLALAAELPYRIVSSHMVLDASINGQPATFIFDTGAFKTVLMPEAAARLGLKRQRGSIAPIIGIGGMRQAAMYEARTLHIGTLHGEKWHFIVADLGLSAFNPPVDGSLGADILWQYDIDIDVPDSKVVLYGPQHDCSKPSVFLNQPLYGVPLEKPFRFVPSPRAPAFIKAFFALSPPVEASPRIRVMIAGKPIVAEIDSGAPHSVLFLGAASRLGLTGDQLGRDPGFLAHGIGPGAVPARRHVIPPITIGELEISNLPVAVLPQDYTKGVDMILGLDLLSRVHAWVSHSSGNFIMQYPPASSPTLPVLPTTLATH